MKALFLTAGLVGTLLSVSAFASGDAAAGEALFKSTARKDKSGPLAACTTCHGDAGKSQSPAFPKLAGQYADYIVHALQSYKEGSRKNALMAPQAGSLTKQDIQDVAAYLSEQSGDLTVKR